MKHPLGTDWSFHGFLMPIPNDNKGDQHEEKGHHLRMKHFFRNFTVGAASRTHTFNMVNG